MFIKHPRSGKKDTMLSLSVYAFFVCLFKFLMNGVSFTIFDYIIDFGTVDATLIAALLTPTLVAYSARKYTDSPDCVHSDKVSSDTKALDLLTKRSTDDNKFNIKKSKRKKRNKKNE